MTEQRRRTTTRGNTLIELLVVLAILGVVAGVTGMAFRTTSDTRVIDNGQAQIAEARRQAIGDGQSLTVIITRDGHAVAATAHADGSIIADTSLFIDRFSGRVRP